ncbi:MAG: ATP-binding cassette domain-containing protein [Chloroflexi bacterium]|nr:ATP-binding cassette domain-containing protein [Chloroflexota bacterium]
MPDGAESGVTSRAEPQPAIVTEGLYKSFGAVKALDGVALVVQPGTVMALLGPNGAGKTTVIRILATLMRPDSGRAEVLGHDVLREAVVVRSLIGLTGQYAAVDENLTGRENLEMVGRLYHLGGSEARKRAGELLESLDLAEAADRGVKTYSGGMRRRLDLAASLVARPPVLFLDEPTTGLDPRSRIGLWDTIAGLVKGGTTVLLTTQYLEEADRLANHIAVIDHGRIIEQGTPEYLKECCGGDVLLQLRLSDRSQTALGAEILATFGDGKIRADAETGQLELPVEKGTTILPEVIRRLDARGVAIYDIALRRPTLDDVFLSLTGRTAEASSEEGTAVKKGRKSRSERRKP